MNLLPLNLAKLADIVDPKTARIGTSGVHLKFTRDERFVAEATDCRFLMRISGTCLPHDFPSIAAFESADNGCKEAVIPPAAWKKAFAGAIRTTKKAVPNLQTIAVKIGKKSATFGYTDAKSPAVESTELIDTKFVDVDKVIPEEDTGRDKFTINAKLWSKALGRIAELAEDGHVTLETDGQKIVRLTAKGYGGEDILCLLSPIVDQNLEKWRPKGIASDEERKRIERLESDIARLLSELAEARRAIEQGKQSNDAAPVPESVRPVNSAFSLSRRERLTQKETVK